MGRSARFLEALNARVLVGDGAMGTQLFARGHAPDVCLESLNTTARDDVRAVHETYLEAGADVLETNTFRAHRPHLEAFGLGEKVFEFNYRGARLARQVAGRDRFVAGSVGPIHPAPGPGASALSPARQLEAFAEQMTALAAGGVDLLLLETFTEIAQVRTAIRAARQAAPGLPVIAQMAFYDGHGSLGGAGVVQAVEAILGEGADGVGVNCGRGFADALRVVERIVSLTDAPISVFPNAGLPEVRDGRLVYQTSPQYMADMAERMAALGVNLIGGCCGTDPRSIAAIATRLRGRPLTPRPRPPAGPAGAGSPSSGKSPDATAAPAGRSAIEVSARPSPASSGRADAVVPAGKAPEPAAADGGPPADRGFLERLGKDVLVVAELDTPRGLRTKTFLAGARTLRDAGAHLVSMAENPLASVRMGNVGAACLVRDGAGAEPLVHFTCRDRNTLGLHSDLMGAAALGIRHVLAITGDPAGAPGGGVTSVYDVNSVGLVRIIDALNAGRTAHGMDIGRRAGFVVGVAFNPNFRTMTGQVRKLRQKADAGAHFALSQLVYDRDRIVRVREAAAPAAIPVLPGVMPLVSFRNAMFMHQEVPGVTLPDAVLARMEKRGSGPDAEKEGLEIARELIDAALASGAPGVYIVTPFQRADLSAELVRHARSLRAL